MHVNHALSCLGVVLAIGATGFVTNPQEARAAETKIAKASSDSSQVRRGRYMIVTGNCNDCHTPSYPERDGKVPEREWLLGGGSMGLKGPWVLPMRPTCGSRPGT